MVTAGGVVKVIVFVAATAGQAPPVVVRVNTKLPDEISPAVGVY
jgi:hypothetical protein